MKAITSKEKLLRKLDKNNLLTDGFIFYLSDFHKTKVGKALVNKLINDKTLELATYKNHWFETSYKLRKPVGVYKGVEIFNDIQNDNFFFFVKKGSYLLFTYEQCIKKIDYLIALNEPLK